jgi:glycosyltransferase involved in cell wall biosynthesis
MTPPRLPRVLVLAVGIGTGGAETLIRDSLPLLRGEAFDPVLWVLKEGGEELNGMVRAGYSARSLSGPGDRLGAPLLRLLREIRAEKFDLVHSHLFWANLCARAAARWAPVRGVINSHHGTDGWLKLSHRLLEQGTAALADRQVACSEAVRSFAIDRFKYPARKIVTIPNGIPIERFADRSARSRMRLELKLEARQFAIGSVGRLDEPVKGYAVLLEALAKLAGRHPNLVCLLCGDGAARADLEEQVRLRGLENRVRFLGERRDVPAVLQAMDLYVQPSLLEGFGLSVLEAMATGLPVLATRTGGLPEVVQEGVTGDLVPPADARRLAEAMDSLLRDPARCRAYGSAGEARARREFPLERMIRSWSELYREVLKEKGWRAAA